MLAVARAVQVSRPWRVLPLELSHQVHAGRQRDRELYAVLDRSTTLVSPLSTAAPLPALTPATVPCSTPTLGGRPTPPTAAVPRSGDPPLVHVEHLDGGPPVGGRWRTRGGARLPISNRGWRPRPPPRCRGWCTLGDGSLPGHDGVLRRPPAGSTTVAANARHAGRGTSRSTVRADGRLIRTAGRDGGARHPRRPGWTLDAAHWPVGARCAVVVRGRRAGRRQLVPVHAAEARMQALTAQRRRVSQSLGGPARYLAHPLVGDGMIALARNPQAPGEVADRGRHLFITTSGRVDAGGAAGHDRRARLRSATGRRR